MKLVRFPVNGQFPRLGALQGDRIADLHASLAHTLARRGVVRAQEIAATLVPQSTRGFLEGGAASHEAVASIDRKSTRLNSSHGYISYAVFCLKKKKLARVYRSHH